MHSVELLTIISAAFIIGVGHCIGMCGGIVVAYSSTKIDEASSWSRQTFSHLAYNLGRVTTYTIIGMIFGFIGQNISFTMITRGILLFVVGVLMILTGLSLLGNFKFLNSANWSISKNGWFQASFKKLLTNKSIGSFYLLGILNGMLPCGPVYAFAIAAAGTASPFWGAIVMAAFGLSTIPALLFLGSVTKLLQRGQWRDMMLKVGAILVILYGSWTLFKGYNFIAHPEIMAKKIHMMENNIGNMIEKKSDTTQEQMSND
ncbi:MAG: sulfite exporter TauE/SafE family protein [Campylobacterales bacterium]|nr:sulfite exporter TauE/SafE family protein [Campylobacterales bacterium]